MKKYKKIIAHNIKVEKKVKKVEYNAYQTEIKPLLMLNTHKDPKFQFKLSNDKLIMHDFEQYFEYHGENIYSASVSKNQFRIWNDEILPLWNITFKDFNQQTIFVFGQPHSFKTPIIFLPNHEQNLLSLTLSYLNNFKESQHEILISIIGVQKNGLIDYLNLSQPQNSIHAHKIHHSQNNNTVPNMIQMAIKTNDDLQSVYSIYQNSKQSLKDLKVHSKCSVIYQFSIASMNEDKTKIESILKKVNIVKMCCTRENQDQISALNECIAQILKCDDENQVISFKNSKLTNFLSDSFRESVCIFIQSLCQHLPLSEQILQFKGFSSIYGKYKHSKKFINDSDAINQVYQEDIDQIKTLLQDYQTSNNDDKLIKTLQNLNFVDQKGGLQIYQPRIMAETMTSIEKRKFSSAKQRRPKIEKGFN